MSWELNVSITSPGRIPAFAAGDPCSTLLMTGYRSKNAAPVSLKIPSSESRTPSHPVGASIGDNSGGDSGDGDCAPAVPASASDATSAAAAGPLLMTNTLPLTFPKIHGARARPAALPSAVSQHGHPSSRDSTG